MTLIPDGKNSASYTFKIAKKKKKKWWKTLLQFGLGALGTAAFGAILGFAWRPHDVHPPPAHEKPLIIDGPPTNVPHAPAPVPVQKPHRSGPPPDEADDADATPEATAAQAPRREDPISNPPAADPCAHFASLADREVCHSPRLTDQDARLQRLYRMALDSSAEPGLVLDDQRRWNQAREAAASGGPQALGELYQQRIQELSGPG